MAIFQLEPDSAAVNNTESIPTTLQRPNESLFTPLFPEAQADSLLKYVEGYPWTCHYYGQLVAQSNSLEHFDPSTPNLTQPVYEIKDMILQVDSPLNSSYEPSTGVTSSSGSAIVPLGVKPNVGDFFIAQIDTGEDAIFCVISVERKTYRKSTLYDINYTLYEYTSQQPDFTASLRQRVQQTFFFNKDANHFNRDFLVTPSVKHATDTLKAFLQESQTYYLQAFSDSTHGTIMLPGVRRSLYDPLLLQFLGTFIDHDIKISHRWFQYNWEDRYLRQKSIFDLLLARNPSMAGTINTTYSFTPSSQMKGSARQGNIYHTSVDFVLYPTEPHRSDDIDKFHSRSPADLFTEEHHSSKAYFESTLTVRSGNNAGDEDKLLLHPLFKDDYYVVSPAFYDYLRTGGGAQEVSFIEVLMARFIRREAIDRLDLLKVVGSFYSWSSLHQLYLLPVLLLIIKATVL